MADSERDDLTAGEIELLVDGLTDDVSFIWALIDLGLRENPPEADVPPDQQVISAAFRHFDRLLARKLIALGRVSYVDPAQPRGTVAPVMHIAEPIADVLDRVVEACSKAAQSGGWEYSCWIVTTDAGNKIARSALAGRP